jgi:hypothetical protein
MGLPLADGAYQVTTMLEPELVVEGELGVLGLIAYKIVDSAEGSEYPTLFRALTRIS